MDPRSGFGSVGSSEGWSEPPSEPKSYRCCEHLVGPMLQVRVWIRGRALAQKEARKDGPSLLRSLISGADPLVVVVLVVCCVGSCCIEIVSSSRCSSYNDLDF